MTECVGGEHSLGRECRVCGYLTVPVRYYEKGDFDLKGAEYDKAHKRAVARYLEDGELVQVGPNTREWRRR